jgi:NDP-sugar pyrophosphorylase family protein
VNGVPILMNALDRLAAANVTETILVVGYLEDMIRRKVGTRVDRMRIGYQPNTEYAVTGTSRSLWIGLDGVDEDVLVIEGDVYFEQRVIDDFVAAPYPDATLVEPWNPTLDGSLVELDADRTVRRWTHKNDRPQGYKLEGMYKTVNLHRFSSAFVRRRLRPALAVEVARGGRAPIETVFARLAADGATVHAVDVRGRWVEIDDEHDLQIAEFIFRGAADGSR